MYKVILGNYGRHVIATENIEKDTIILIESPSIICEDMYDCIYKLSTECHDQTENFLKMVPHEIDKYTISYSEIYDDVQSLPEYMKEYFLNMDKIKLRIMATKFYRNGFNYINRHGGPNAILFVGNILNHSCDPNIVYNIDEKTGKFIFRTNKFIYKNEELVHSYIDKNMSYKKRQKILLEQYGFVCKCIKCNNSSI